MYLVYVSSSSLIWQVQYAEWIHFEDQILLPKHDQQWKMALQTCVDSQEIQTLSSP